MGGYSVLIKPSAWKELDAIGTKAMRRLVADRVRALAQDPRPPGCERLAGQLGVYRIRQGDYRILYTVHDSERIVRVSRIGHRRDVYR